MAFIYETPNFIVESFETPHVSRTDGGNLRILPKKKLLDRTKLPPSLAIEFMRLTMIVGAAFARAMEQRGIELTRINYQDMGNWAFKTGETPFFHLHIYGRAKNAIYQPYKEAVQLPDRSSGFYKKFVPLNNEDIKEIRKQIEIISREKKYKLENWKLNTK